MNYRVFKIRIILPIGILLLTVFSVYAQTAEEYFKRAVADTKEHNYDQAIIDCTKSIELNPKYANVYVNRGNAFVHKGRFSQAVLDYTKAVEINPKDADIYYNRGIAYFYQKDFARAWKDVHMAESLGYKVDPKFLEALKKTSGRES